MADVARQGGRPSRFAYAKQSAFGTFTNWTDIYNAASFDLSFTPNTDIYKTLAGSLDSEAEARQGVAEIAAKLSGPMRGIQGIAFLKGLIGSDTYTAALTSFGTLSGTIVAGANSITLSATAPAPPAGIADWIGAPLTIDPAGTAETVTILSVAGTTVKISPTLLGHTTGVVLQAPAKLHCFQPNTGANAASLDYLSLIGQWARVKERRAQDAQVFAGNIKGVSGKDMTVDYTLAISAALPYDGAFSTTITPSATEAADTPFKLQDGALFTYGAAADTVMSPHKRMQDFDWQLSIADQKIVEGGTPQAVVQHVLGERTAKLMWTDTAGEQAFSTFFTDFVATAGTTTPLRLTPALLAYNNTSNGNQNYLSIYHPSTVATGYDPSGPTDAAIAYKGSLNPLLDPVTGILVRSWVVNGVASAY